MINTIAKVVLLICSLIVIVVSIIGFIKAQRIKAARKRKLGYNSLTSTQSVNILKTKCEKYYKRGCIPTALNDRYQELNRDTAVGYARFLNRLLRKYRKRFKYYKKKPDYDKLYSNKIQYTLGVFKKSHPKLFVSQNVNTERVY